MSILKEIFKAEYFWTASSAFLTFLAVIISFLSFRYMYKKEKRICVSKVKFGLSSVFEEVSSIFKFKNGSYWCSQENEQHIRGIISSIDLIRIDSNLFLNEEFYNLTEECKKILKKIVKKIKDHSYSLDEKSGASICCDDEYKELLSIEEKINENITETTKKFF